MSRTGNEVKSQSAPATNIPTVRTSFVGRKREIEDVAQLLGSSRLVTLTGAAGCGKTRLALRVGRETGGHYAHGAHWVDLARLEEPALVPQTIARVLRVPEQADRPAVERLLEALRERQLLLVLDNCEHLLSACARLVARVLAETDASVLATSRESLNVRGERLYPVAPLSLPPRTPPAASANAIGQYDAIQLFVERARAILPAFGLTAENAHTIAAICRHLDGIPLAIELASARVNVLTLEQITARLDNHFELLPAATHTTFSHHDTLRTAIDWSYELLSEPEQLLLRRLSVFAGGCTLATAEAVCTGEGVEREQVLELLASLVNRSLVTAETLHRGEAHYRLLEPIRQYAQEKLMAADEWTAIRDRHLRCFLQLAEETAPKLRGEYQQLWLDWLEGEYDNIRAALSWSSEGGSTPLSLEGGPTRLGLEGGPTRLGLEGGPTPLSLEAGLRIAIAIYEFWLIRNYVEEGVVWLERLLDQTGDRVPQTVRANALAYASFLAGFLGNSSAQAKYGREAVALAEAAGEVGQSALAWARAGEAYAHGRPGPLPTEGSALARALAAQAYGARAAGDHQTELTLYQRIVRICRRSGERQALGIALVTGSSAAVSLGKYSVARAMLDEGLPLLREAGNPYWIAMTLNGSGDLARCEQNYARAKSAYEESISLLRDLDARRDLASVLHNLGHTCLHLGDVERARALFDESIALQQAQRNTVGIAECLIGYAALAIVEGLPDAGARLLAAAVAIGGEQVTTAWAATRLEYEHYLERARARLSEEQFESEQAAGRALSLEEAVAYAQDVAQEATAAEETRKKLDELTPREREVAVLIAQAMSNAEIAEELVISKRTVEKHISNIRSKLAFTKRAQIVRWAIENGLVNASE